MASESANIIMTAAKAGKNLVGTVIETTKEFLNELVHPNMTIEKISEVAGEHLDEVIVQNEKQGLKYSAGKFKISYLDETHFGLAFEMYFKDEAGKWYKSSGESEPRDAELLDVGSWKTLQTLKAVEFPISAPLQTSEEAEPIEEEPAEDIKAIESPKDDVKPAKPKSDVTLDDLLNASKKQAESKLKLGKD